MTQYEIMSTVSSLTGLLQGDNLKAKSARAVMKLAVGTGAERILRFVRYMILTRILAPEDLGILAIILPLVAIFEAFTEVGVKQSIIQNKRGADHEYLNVAWWFQSVRGLGLSTFTALAAPLICSAYGKPELVRLVQFTCLAAVFRGFISPRAHVLEKEYRFGRAILLIQGGAVLGTIITISLALVTRNVWALVIGYVAEQGVLCLLSYVLAPFGPKLGIDRICLAELWKFARGMFGLPIMTLIAYAAPFLVLGRVDFITDGQVGMYSMAVQLVNVPILFFARIIQPVMLPGLAGRQDDQAFLSRAVLKITQGVAMFGIPLVAFVACFAKILLRLAWGPQYAAVAIPCAVLSLQIMTRTEGIVLATTYMAIGRPNLLRAFVALRAGMVVALIYPAVIHYGLPGAAAAIALANVAALLIQTFCYRKIMHLTFGSYMRSYIPGLLLALPVIATVGLLHLLGVDSAMLELVIGVFVLAGTFAASLFVLSRPKKSSAITSKVSDN
ncbi:MAG: hypothetical protein CEE38_02675 [Planctomycetes bacterium B3_Pla]|nr:MAG: hypothetical protein CEE38_02675 [Planctomycetes bacterium B3_Pla]